VRHGDELARVGREEVQGAAPVLDGGRDVTRLSGPVGLVRQALQLVAVDEAVAGGGASRGEPAQVILLGI